MGVVGGFVSAKYIVAATGMLIAARVDQVGVRAIVDPHISRSSVTRDFARRHHLDRSSDAQQAANLRRVSIRLGGKEFDQPELDITDAPPPPETDMVIGRDILEKNVFAFEIRHHELLLLNSWETSRLPQHFTSVSVTLTGQGKLTIPATIDGRVEQAGVELAQADRVSISAAAQKTLPAGQPVQVQVGGVILRDEPALSQAPAADGAVTLGLGAFDGRTVVLDLPHQKLWISAVPRASL